MTYSCYNIHFIPRQTWVVLRARKVVLRHHYFQLPWPPTWQYCHPVSHTDQQCTSTVEQLQHNEHADHPWVRCFGRFVLGWCHILKQASRLSCSARKRLFTPYFFRRAILTRKVGQTGRVLACVQDSLVWCTQDYKSLCAAITICSTLVNIQTHNRTHSQTTFWPAYTKSSASWAKNGRS